MDRTTLQLIILILVLTACTPRQIALQLETSPQQNTSTTPPSPVSEVYEEPPTRTVHQTGSNPATYGLSDDNRILIINKPNANWTFYYDAEKLTSITGPESITFLYTKNKLHNITREGKTLTLTYDSRDRLVQAQGGRETLHFDYDSLDLVRAVRRGAAGKTSIDYDKQGRIKYLTRGLLTTSVYFTNRSKVNNFDADDIKLILAYGRDDRLGSLSGKMFGPGLTVSYGPNYPPTEAKIIHAIDDSIFQASYKETLYPIVDNYLYCNYLSRYKDLLFDGISYTFYTSYFTNNISNYLAMQFTCIPFSE